MEAYLLTNEAVRRLCTRGDSHLAVQRKVELEPDCVAWKKMLQAAQISANLKHRRGVRPLADHPCIIIECRDGFLCTFAVAYTPEAEDPVSKVGVLMVRVDEEDLFPLSQTAAMSMGELTAKIVTHVENVRERMRKLLQLYEDMHFI